MRLKLAFIVLSVMLVAAALPAQASSTAGTYQIDFVAINSPTGTPTLTEAQARSWVNQMNQVYESITAGKIKLEFRSLYPTQTTTERITTPIGIKTKFPAAATPKVSTAVKSVLVGVLAKDVNLGFSGIATFSGDEIILNGIDGADEVNVSVLVHEFGHILSLAHANSANCANSADLATCTLTEYGDFSDIMGKYFKSYVSYDSRFNGISLGQLGVITENQVYLANGNVEVDLIPLYSTQPGYKLIYLPIYNRMGYAVEYRPAVGIDGSLAQTRIYTATGSYYVNTPSYGLQVRFLGSQQNPEEKFLPKTDATSNTIFYNSNRTRQGFDAGESITLPDGSVVKFVSGAGDAAVKVKVERPQDTQAPKITLGDFSFLDEGKLPKLQLGYESLFDDRYVTKLELLINSSVVTTITNPGTSGTLDHQLTSAKPFSYQVIATDAAGNQNKTEVKSGLVGCSDKKCYVGATWEYQGPSFGPKLGTGQLQQLVSGKWVVRAKANPVKKDGLYTYIFRYSPTKAGTATYRFYIPPSRNWAAFVGKPFKQKILG